MSDPEKARLYYEQNPTHNVGLLAWGRLEPVRWTSIMSEYTKLIFEKGTWASISQKLNAVAPQIIGRENPCKLIFKAPPI